MSQMEIDKVLSQMRVLTSQMERPVTAEPVPASGNGFGDLLRQSISEVSSQQESSQALITGFQTGTTDASVAEVMVAMQKASLSFTAMTQVRNRLVDAYHEVMNMPI